MDNYIDRVRACATLLLFASGLTVVSTLETQAQPDSIPESAIVRTLDVQDEALLEADKAYLKALREHFQLF